MKKFGFLFGTATAVAAGTYAFSSLAHKALVRRKFVLPDWLTKAISENDGSAFEQKHDECLAWLEEYGYEKHTLISDDGLKLRGYLMRPSKPSDVYIFGSHGYRSDGKGEWCYFAQHYVEDLGFNFFFVDHRASGESEGEYIGFDYFESKDCLKWLGYLNDNFGEDIQIILHGISMGAATVTVMSGSDELPKNVKFIISDCAYTSARDEFEYKVESFKAPKAPLVPIVNAINKKKTGYDFGTDTSAIEAVKRAKVPMLFVHGKEDKFVPTYMVYLFHEAYQGEYKDILVVDGAEHAQSYHYGKDEYDKKIDEFIQKFIAKRAERI